MNHTYELVSAERTDDQGVVHTVYGIAVQASSGITERRIDDIFFEKATAVRFVEACNILSLDPDHLDDVIADALCV